MAITELVSQTAGSPASGNASSPVFDLSLIQGENTNTREEGKEKEKALHAFTNNAKAKPQSPTTSRTLNSYDVVVEDDSSVSTFGSVMSSTNSVGSSRRSVFSKYWSATGQRPMLSERKRTLSNASNSTTSTAASTSGAPTTSSSSRRSIIFSQKHCSSYSSLPSTLQTTEEEPVMPPTLLERKSLSTSDLDTSSNKRCGTPLASCLRPDPLYSGEGSKGARPRSQSFNTAEWDETASVSSSVRFDLAKTDVRHFDPPKEFHAEQGWTDYFY